jgi:hypothetical protein
LIAQSAVFFEGFFYDSVKIRRQMRIDMARGDGSFMQKRIEDHRGGVPVKAMRPVAISYRTTPKENISGRNAFCECEQ